MSINKTYAVFGLGRYGKAVAEELVKNGAEVLGVDVDQDIVDNAVETIPVCKCADITEAEVIKRLGISNMDIVIVSMANNLEASVMAVTLCKEAGVETVIAKCASEMQEKILKRVGADRVVFPERESGIRLGRSLITSGFSEMIELSKEVSMIEQIANKVGIAFQIEDDILEMDVKTEWIGKTLIELNLRKKYGINVVAARKGNIFLTTIEPTLSLEKGMQLIVIAEISKIQKLK